MSDQTEAIRKALERVELSKARWDTLYIVVNDIAHLLMELEAVKAREEAATRLLAQSHDAATGNLGQDDIDELAVNIHAWLLAASQEEDEAYDRNYASLMETLGQAGGGPVAPGA